jgi:predicted membrane protein
MLAIALTAVAAIDVPLRGGFGERRWAPASERQLERQSPFRLAAGDAVLDLRDTRLGAGDHDVEVSVAFGQLTVLLPEDVAVDLDIEVQAGQISTEVGSDDEGWDLHVEATDDPPGSEASVALEIDVAFGDVAVRRG